MQEFVTNPGFVKSAVARREMSILSAMPAFEADFAFTANGGIEAKFSPARKQNPPRSIQAQTASYGVSLPDLIIKEGSH